METIVNGVRLSYTSMGAGPAVVCIHGNGLNSHMWRRFVPEASQDYRVITYDLRGAGNSEAPGRPGVAFADRDYASDLIALLDHLQIDRAVLVGHAFGGFVAARTALDWPQRAAALVLSDAGARIEGKTRAAIPGWVEAAEREGMAPLVESGMQRWFSSERFRNENPETIEFYRQMMAENPPYGYAASCRSLLQFDLRDEIHRIECPTLVVGGTEDISISVDDKRRLSDGIPNSTFVGIPGATHMVPEESPNDFNHATLGFLRQVRSQFANILEPSSNENGVHDD